MAEMQYDLKRPIRVVLFGGGPVLERGVKQFICRLDEHPEIEFLGGFCQSEAQSFWAVVKDLWQRRRLLALPLLLVQMASRIGRFLVQPQTEIAVNRKMARLADRIHFVPDIHAEEVLAQVRALAPDLGLIYGSPILKPILFEIPACGTLGIHHGKLPEYRGKKTTFWAMFNGEKTAGVTIQKVNAGLDTGESVKQGEVPIGCRSLRAVWKNLEALGLDLYIQAIIEVKQGTVSYQPQVGRKGKLYRDPKLGEILTFCWKQFKWRLSKPFVSFGRAPLRVVLNEQMMKK
jgi:folate-dependent phosphoribosylglycinamide formyltransferase PurN